MATGTVADVTARLAVWSERTGGGLALVEFDSELARERVVADLRDRLTAADIPLHELALSANGGPPEVVRGLISELRSLETGVASISGFSQVFPLGSSHEEALASFNFKRERLAEVPVRQIWWLPAWVADAFLRGAPDLYSWFTARLHLTETITPWPAARPPIESWISEGPPPTSLEDARQRSVELAGRFERALANSEKPVEELASELMEPAMRALEEAGAEREARELERRLRRRAREQKRPLPPRYDVFLSHNSQDKPAVEELAQRLRSAGIRPFLDKWHLVPGVPWQEGLEEALADSATCAVFLGPRGIGPWENEEMRVALDERTRNRSFRVIPVLLPDATRPVRKELPRFLRRLTWVDFGEGLADEDALQRLIAGVQGLPPGPPSEIAKATSCRYWNVPYRLDRIFTGRDEELTTLRQTLQQKGTAALGQTQAISGLGGIGKTRTAVEYARRHRDDYHAVLWVRAETEAELASGFAELAAVLDLPEKDAENQEDAIRAVKRWLTSNDSWLLVLDNADDPELVEPFVPVAHRGHVLLTSRAWNLSRLKIVRPLRLDALKRDEAVTFLLRRTGREDAGEEQVRAAAELAGELGDLPLALVQAAAYVHSRQSRFDDYLASYCERRLRLLEGGEPDDYPASVATTWALNFEDVERTSAASAEILRLSAFLAPDRIPLEILTLGASELGPTLSSALQITAEDSLALDELLVPLSLYSLIERELETRSFSVHRMVQEAVRAGLDDESQRRWAERAVRALSLAFPSPEVPNWPLCERLLPQAAVALEITRRYGLELKPMASMLNEAGVYLKVRGRYVEAAPMIETSLTISEKLLGDENPIVATSLNNLANLYRAQGNYAAAAALYKRSLAIWEKVLGREHPTVAASLNNLATLEHDRGDYAAAVSLTQRSLAISEKALGSEHPIVAASLNNLAELYRVQKDYASATPLYQRSLAIREKMLGPEHPDVAQSLNNLALLHDDQGDFASAVPLYERSLAISERVLGSEHPDVARSLYNLASLHFAQGDTESAAQLYEKSLAIFEKTLGGEHPQVAAALEGYARLLLEVDRTKEGAALEARAKAIRVSQAGQVSSPGRK